MSAMNCVYRSAPWRLSSTSSFMLTALSTLVGADRYRLTASVLEGALASEASSREDIPSVALRDNDLSPGRVKLPVNLIEAIRVESSARGWSQELLVEFLVAKYVPSLLGEAASSTAAGLLLAAHESKTPSRMLSLSAA